MAGVRVVNIIHKWLKRNSHYVDEGVSSEIRKFMQKELKKDKIFESQIQSIEDELTNTSQYELPNSITQTKPPEKIMGYIGELYAPYESVLLGDEMVIAQQLTLIEFDIYSKIKEMELLGQAWSSEKRSHVSPNVIQLLQRANRTANWVATCILLQSKVKDRTKVLSKFMTIAKHLKDLNNYNTLMGIIAGLNTVAVSRLKYTFLPIKRNITEIWDVLMDIMNPSNAFKKLRTTMEECGPTALPYIGMYLSDLTFLEDGNPDEITREGTPPVKLINFSKHFMIYRAIDQIRKYQTSAKFNIEKREPMYSFLHELAILTEEELYQLSMNREPRDAPPNLIK